MVVDLPLSLAELVEVTERAVGNGKRVNVESAVDRVEETCPDAAVIGGKLRRPERFTNAGTEHDVHPLRLTPLNARHLFAVEAKLEDVVRLCMPGELRVRNLVGVRAEIRGHVHALQKVGMPSPPRGIEEDR